MICHERFTQYKTAATEAEREQARQRYLESIGMPADFRWWIRSFSTADRSVTRSCSCREGGTPSGARPARIVPPVPPSESARALLMRSVKNCPPWIPQKAVSRLISIPHPWFVKDSALLFDCRANGRSALIDRFAAGWATVRQRLCFKAIFC